MLATLLAILVPAAAHAGAWHSEQPPPPAGTTIGVPVPLGAIGDIAFWAPNRGLLTTAGNDGVPAGLYAYDGTGWHELSTVCGGHDGRIAWAGPDEWWTIADQSPGQELGPGGDLLRRHRSLCHFVDGQVVASYAEPIGAPNSYLPLNAAACLAPDDCWFAGDRLPGTTNTGAFHLHWDGHALSAVPSLSTNQPDVADPGRAVADLAVQAGHLYESVQVQQDDVSPDESADQPYLLHEIVTDSSNPFLPLFTDEPIDYGSPDVRPSDLSALKLSSDGAQLWAIGGAIVNAEHAAPVTVLRLDASGIAQIALNDPGVVLSPGVAVNGVAADPSGDGAWVAYTQPDDLAGSADPPARLTRIDEDGTVEPPILLPGDGDGISRKGPADKIACPTSGQCWMATTQGWLFHLGGTLPQDTDPTFHRLITFRPPDDGLPSLPPDALPVDDSGADQPSDQTPAPHEDGPAKPRPRARPLAYRIHERMVHRTTLELTFSLRAKAHVQLIARRRKRIVARTRRVTMRAGKHRLLLRLDPRRWPTKLDLKTSAVHAKAPR